VGFTPLCLDVVSLLCIVSVLIISLYFSLALWKLTAVIVAYFSHVRKKKKEKSILRGIRQRLLYERKKIKEFNKIK
jgi:predicted membrane protein